MAPFEAPAARRPGNSGRRTLLLPVVFAILCLVHLVPAIARVATAAAGTAEVAPDVQVPQKARDMLAQIQKRHGEPPRGYIGGRTFRNRDRHLPAGSYREYDVNPKVRGRDRGAERIVIERRSGRAYYTQDHYETFVPMN